MSLDCDWQSAKELVENLFILNIRIKIPYQKALRERYAESDGLAANASFRNYFILKNKSLKRVIYHVERQ